MTIPYTQEIQKQLITQISQGKLEHLDFADYHLPGKLIKNFQAHDKWISSVAVLGNDQVITSGWDNTIKIWELETGKCLQTLRHTDTVYSVAVLNNRQIVSGSADKTVKIWDIESGYCLFTLTGHEDLVRKVAIVANSHIIVSGSIDKTIKIWDAYTGTCLRTLSAEGPITNIAVIDSNHIVSVYKTDKGVALSMWNIDSGECLDKHERLYANGWIDEIAVINNKHIAIGLYKEVHFWTIKDDKNRNTLIYSGSLEGHSYLVTSIVNLGDGLILTGSYDHSLKIWDLKTRKCIRTLLGHTDCVNSVAVLKDGRIISGGRDSMLKVWETLPSLGYSDVAPVLDVITTPLKTLSLKGVNLGVEGVGYVKQLIRKYPKLQVINLEDTQLSFEQEHAIYQVLEEKNRSIDEQPLSLIGLTYKPYFDAPQYRFALNNTITKNQKELTQQVANLEKAYSSLVLGLTLGGIIISISLLALILLIGYLILQVKQLREGRVNNSIQNEPRLPLEQRVLINNQIRIIDEAGQELQENSSPTIVVSPSSEEVNLRNRRLNNPEEKREQSESDLAKTAGLTKNPYSRKN